jgi:hypothetical protein
LNSLITPTFSHATSLIEPLSKYELIVSLEYCCSVFYTCADAH